MKLNLAFAAVVIAALVLAASGATLESAPPVAEGPVIGKPAPEIDGRTWLNHIGAPPSLASLRGQAVLLEFWATW
jgi:hypothetical protein